MEKQGTILAVDDDEEFLLYIETTLKREGYEIASASSAAQAKLLLKNRRFDLILSDLRLPGASGLDILAQGRALDPLSVGIVVTAHSSLDTALQALREGAYDYLVKPCDSEALVAAV